MDITKFIDTIKKGENEQVEFKANIQKEIANDICAFLNTDGGYILIGVSDDGDVNGIDDFNSSKQKLADIINSINPHPEVKTSCLDLTFMQKQGKCILIIEVAKGDKLYSYKNRVNIRVGRNNRTLTIQELIEKASESILILFDEQTSKYNSEVVSKKLFEDYLNKRFEKRGIEKSGTIEENLRQLKITKGVKATNGGILCFSNNPQNYIPYARIRLVKFENENTKSYSDMREFTGPISKIMADIEKYFLSIFKVFGEETESFQRKEYLEYPILALREAVANSLVHRNYYDPSEILIMIFPSKLMIRNPGSFPPGVFVKSPIHKARNPILARCLYDLGFIEGWGSGINKIISQCDEHPLVKVDFIIHPYHTEVIFFKEIEKIKEKLDEISLLILELLEKDGALGSGVICERLNKSKPTIVGKLNQLFSYGFIEKEGSGPRLKYIKSKERKI